MTAATAPKPLVPADLAKPNKALVHAAFATLTGAMQGGAAALHCQRLYPNDTLALALLTRAAVAGGSTVVSGWASQLIDKLVADWVASLAPESAMAAVISQGLVLTLSGEGSISVPGRSGAPQPAGYVGEGLPIPVRQLVLGAATLSPRKVGCAIVWSRELSRLSSADRVFEAMLREDAAASLDACYLSATAGSATAHAGLLNGLSAIAGSAVMTTDLSKLVAAVAPLGDPVFIAAPGRAAVINLSADINAVAVPSLAVPADRVICLDPASLVHGFDGEPDILAADNATIHMESVPLDIATGAQGSGVIATPTTNLFQTAQLGLRMLLDIAFAARRSGAVAYVEPCTW